MVGLSFCSRFLFRTDERDEVRMISKFITPNSVVLELGASLGLVSCLTNQKIGTTDTHVVVEAHPALITVLQSKKELNQSSFHIEHGIVSKSSDGTFYIHELVVGGSAVRKTGTRVNVPVVSMDQLETKCKTKFSILICDVEGGELQLIEEFPEFFERVETVIIEIHPFILGDHLSE